MTDHAPRRLRVKEVIAETHDARSLVFEGPPLDYRPGQFLTLRIPSDLEPTARCYSLSSSPHVDELLKVTVKRTTGGYGSNWVCDTVVAGTELEVLPPAGHFSPRDLDTDLLLCAGGSGITPIVSIIKSALQVGRRRIVVLYANRDESSVIFADELAALSASHSDRLVVLHWLESVQGLPSVVQLRELLRPYADFSAYLCGPAPYMAAVERALAELAVPRDRIHVERFQSLASAPWDAPVDIVEDGGPTATVHVDLDGTTTQLAWPRSTRLLDLLLAKGLDAPYSCRQGNCSACACKLVSGEVTMVANSVLEQEDLDEGWVLACQSLPVSDVVSVSYD
ncbi:MAG: ferredoxin--NADP reductase [Actinomycetota bacterium]|nr:ferredoxin--NADP reductase [Actinomycetota bacterium]